LGEVYTRKWDLKGAPSVCVHCGLGCNTIPNARQGYVRRVLNRYNGEVNGYFLCDRGRFGYGFLNSARRIRRSLTAAGGVASPVTRGAALSRLSELLREQDAIGIGSPRASMEANFALRCLVGAERFYSGLGSREERLLSTILAILREGHARTASLREAEDCDAVLVLGEDVAETAPRLALSLRQAVRQAGMATAERLHVPRWQDAAVREAGRDVLSPLALATPSPTRLDDVASFAYRAAPADIARLGFAIAHVIDATAPKVADLAEPVQRLAERIATALAAARRPLVVSGAGAGSEAVIGAAGNVADALCRTGRTARIMLTVPECNSLGLALMRAPPLSAALTALRDGQVRTVVVLENDLYRRADAATVDAALGAATHVIALDHVRNDTVQQAELVLAAGTFVEASGTLVSQEGRAQRYFQLLFPEDDVVASWKWLNAAAVACGRSAPWRSLDDAIAALAKEMPALAAIGAAAPSAGFRVDGNRIASEPHRYSGRTALHADRSVFEPKPPPHDDGPYTNSMEGYYGTMPAALYPYIWAPAWNSVQALNKFQAEVGGAMAGGDAGVRLLQSPLASRGYARDVPPPFAPREHEWLILPQYELFGSEELSALAPAILERSGRVRIALNAQDAATLSVADGETVAVALAPAAVHAKVSIHPALPHGIAALSTGARGFAGTALPAFARLSRVGNVEAVS
jgi:NADH-quinone oxidoreductase subunit G